MTSRNLTQNSATGVERSQENRFCLFFRQEGVREPRRTGSWVERLPEDQKLARSVERLRRQKEESKTAEKLEIFLSRGPGEGRFCRSDGRERLETSGVVDFGLRDARERPE